MHLAVVARDPNALLSLYFSLSRPAHNSEICLSAMASLTGRAAQRQLRACAGRAGWTRVALVAGEGGVSLQAARGPCDRVVCAVGLGDSRVQPQTGDWSSSGG